MMARSRPSAESIETNNNQQECTCFAVTFIFDAKRNRLPGVTCDFHQAVEFDENKSSLFPAHNPVPLARTPVTSGSNPSAFHPVLTLDGFAWCCQLDPASLNAIELEVNAISTAGSRKCRNIISFDSKCLADVISSVVRNHPHGLGRFGPLAHQGEAVIAAGPFRQRLPAEQHKLGRLHRDCLYGDPGYLTMLGAVDEVTGDNGSITIWLGSQRVACNQKHRDRALPALEKLQKVTLTGPKGTFWFFDSRLLHQSNPNFTHGTRRTVQCFLRTEGMLPLTITS
jgi:hypothetical protein